MYNDYSFWSDGMVRVSGREYNGLIDSPCYKHGDEDAGILSCLSCHVMHKPPDDIRTMSQWANDQLLNMDGNQACRQCHDGFEDDSKLVSHTHHKANSTGSLCYNCHMPYTTYGLLKAIRSHEIDSPTVAASLKTGRPNACNQCHLDRTLAWTADHLSQWYGTSEVDLSDDQRELAGSVLWLLSGDAGQRALMAWSMGWQSAQQASGSDWMGIYLAHLLKDRYDAVRFIAYRSLRSLPGFEDFTYDHLEAADLRSAASQRAIKIWRQLIESSGREADEAILIRASESKSMFRQNVFDRLAGQRDDRPLFLFE